MKYLIPVFILISILSIFSCVSNPITPHIIKTETPKIETYLPPIPKPVPNGWKEYVWANNVNYIYNLLRKGDKASADSYLVAAKKYYGVEFAESTRKAAELMKNTQYPEFPYDPGSPKTTGWP